MAGSGDWNSVSRQWKDWLARWGGPQGSQARIAYALIGAFLLLLTLLSAFYTVEPDEEAVVLRFGRYVETTGPGLHFKIPFWIDEAVKVKTKLILQEEFGFRTVGTSGASTKYSDENFSNESLMLTGDLNVADVEWTVQFQISDAKKYLFGVRDPITTIRDVSHAILRRVVGDRLVTDVLTVGRIEISEEATRLLQEIMDKYDIGIHVVAVKLQDVNPPEPVKPSFNEVNSAKQEQEQLINQAEKAYNKVIPEARGSAEKAIAEAQGYSTSLLNRAYGDAQKLEAVMREYHKAPEVTRKRLYLETMQEVLKKVEHVTIIDEALKGVLPIYEAGQGKPVVVPVPENGGAK